MTEAMPSEPHRLLHFSPLRYPGGKAKLADFVKALLETNSLCDGHYCEPYAGGAAIALELLFQGYVDQIHINDISAGVYAFWHAVLFDTRHLVRRIEQTSVTVCTWEKQKQVLAQASTADPLDLAFAVFFLNRTNRSGILNGGIIGGRDQTGPWKIDARYNTSELIHRIVSIADLNDRIQLTNLDALRFLDHIASTLPARKTMIYLDPPYYKKGKELYYDFYQHDDHVQVANHIRSQLSGFHWIVSYDNVAPIHAMYTKFRSIEYSVGYSAREVKLGSEVMFFSPKLKIPPAKGAMELTRGVQELARTSRHPSKRSTRSPE